MKEVKVQTTVQIPLSLRDWGNEHGLKGSYGRMLADAISAIKNKGEPAQPANMDALLKQREAINEEIKNAKKTTAEQREEEQSMKEREARDAELLLELNELKPKVVEARRERLQLNEQLSGDEWHGLYNAFKEEHPNLYKPTESNIEAGLQEAKRELALCEWVEQRLNQKERVNKRAGGE